MEIRNLIYAGGSILDAFNLGGQIKMKSIEFNLAVPTYAELKGKMLGFNIDNLHWTEVKFLDHNGNLHQDMNTIPNNIGGIYTFRIKSDVLPGLANYLVYVGRAQHNRQSYGLKSRCRSYLNDNRKSIERMRRTWGQHLYISYVPLNDNELIRDLEDYLIESLLPVFNSDIKNPTIRSAVGMFRN